MRRTQVLRTSGGHAVVVLVTNHVLSGAALAAGPLAGRRPLVAFGAGVVSHFVLDAIPHWGDRRHEVFWRTAVVDGLCGLAAMALMTRLAPPQRRLTVLAGMAGAAFPDLDKPSREFFGRSFFPRRWDAFHTAIQRESPRRLPQEFVVAAALSSVAVGLSRRPPP